MATMEQRIWILLLSARNGYLIMTLLSLLLVLLSFYQSGRYQIEVFAVLVLGQAVYWLSYLYYLRTQPQNPRPEDSLSGHF